MAHRFVWSVGFALLVAAAGCGAPQITIERSRPACIQVGSEAKIAVRVTTEGDPPERKTKALVDAAIDAAGGQFLNKRAAAEPLWRELERELGRGVNPVVDLASADFIVLAHPTEWSYEGPILTQPDNPGHGHLRVHIDVVRANSPGEKPVYGSTYWSKVEAPDETRAIEKAAHLLAERFTADLRPSRVCNVVEMDDSDPRTSTGISLCRSGEFEAAHTAFSDLAAGAPGSAPALYDLAVLKESRGEYDEAEALLLRATKIAQKPIYYSALARVRAARVDAEALGSAP